MARSVGSMDNFNKPLLVPGPPYSVKKLMDAINKEKLLLADMKKEKLLLADIKKPQLFLPFLAVLVVSLWGFFSACFHCVLSISGPSTSYQQCLESKTCKVLPDVFVSEENAILYWLLLCCSVSQAPAAMLTLLLTGHRRRAVAYAMVATSTAGHCMYGRIQWLLLAAYYPGDDGIISSVMVAIVFLLGDLLCLLVLILVGVTEEERGKIAQIKRERGKQA